MGINVCRIRARLSNANMFAKTNMFSDCAKRRQQTCSCVRKDVCVRKTYSCSFSRHQPLPMNDIYIYIYIYTYMCSFKINKIYKI